MDPISPNPAPSSPEPQSPPVTPSQPSYAQPVQAPPQYSASSTSQPAYASPPLAQSTPGKGLAIAGIILSVTGFQLIGLILSIVAKKKAPKPSTASTLALVGIILNLVFGLVAIAIFTSFFLNVFKGVQDRAKTMEASSTLSTNTVKAQAAAASVRTIALSAASTTGALPTSSADLGLTSDVSLTTLTSEPSTPTAVEYDICDSGSSARFGYWDYTTKQAVYSFVDDSDSTGGTAAHANCTPVL